MGSDHEARALLLCSTILMISPRARTSAPSTGPKDLPSISTRILRTDVSNRSSTFSSLIFNPQSSSGVLARNQDSAGDGTIGEICTADSRPSIALAFDGTFETMDEDLECFAEVVGGDAVAFKADAAAKSEVGRLTT